MQIMQHSIFLFLSGVCAKFMRVLCELCNYQKNTQPTHTYTRIHLGSAAYRATPLLLIISAVLCTHWA